MFSQSTFTTAGKAAAFVLALALFGVAAPIAAEDDGPLDPLLKCSETPGCTKMMKAKGFIDGVSETGAAAKQAAIDWFNGQPKEDKLDPEITPREVEKVKPSTHVTLSPEEEKRRLQEADTAVYKSLSETCAAKPFKGDCSGAIDALNSLEGSYEIRRTDSAFKKQFPNFSLRSPGLAQGIGIGQVNKYWEKWDERFGSNYLATGELQ